MNKERFDLELKSIMEEEVSEVSLSDDMKNSILKARKVTFFTKLRDFLNMEIEVPLIPLVSVGLALFIIVGLPRDIFENEKTLYFDSFNMVIVDKGGKRYEN